MLARSICITMVMLLAGAAASAGEFVLVGGTGERWHSGPDARGAALAEAGAAVADGPFALWYNPAAPARSRSVQIGYGSQPYPEIVSYDDRDRNDWGVQGAARGWAFGAVYSRQTVDSIVRTAYDPEGRRFQSERAVLLLGGSYDLARVLGLAPRGWALRLGAAWRHDTAELGIEGTDREHDQADDLDLGLDLRRSYRLTSDARFGWRIGAAWTNVLQASYDYGAPFSTDYRLAAALEGGLGQVDDWGEIIGLMVTYEREEHVQPNDRDGVDRVAGELSFFERLHVRLGWSGDSPNVVDGATWGLGLDLVPRGEFPVTGRIDFARGTYLRDSWLEETLNRWSFVLRAHF